MTHQGNISRARILPLEDLACAALFAFFAMQGSIPGIAPAQALEMTASAPSSLNTFGGIAAQTLANTLILALILRRPRLLLRQIAGLPWLLVPALLALLAVASCAWSLDPLLTLRRALPFAFAGLFGLWFSARFPVARQLSILRIALVALALGTIALVLLDPAIGLDHSSGHGADWQGVFTQKNACGRIMVLGTAVVLFGGRLTMSRFGALLLFIFVLVMSGSRAAWLIEVSLLFLWVALAMARRVGRRLRTLLAMAAPIKIAAFGMALLLGVHRLVPFLGRDPTLSGRAAIWLQVSRFILQRPLLGYGYDAFWRGMQGPSFQIAASLHFIVAHAHNGFLEIALELGFAGVLLFGLSWVRAWGALWSPWRRGQIQQIAWPLTFLLLIVLYDLDENTLLIYNGIFWILYVAVIANIERWTCDSRHNAAATAHEMLTATPYAGDAFVRPGPQAAL